MRFSFVVNPRAGRGRGADVARELPALLEARTLSGRVRTTASPGQAAEIAREEAREAEVVVAVGGDGTAHEVVNGIAGSDTAFGLVPVGTGNDLAHALGVPSDVAGALDVLASARERRIDLGRFDDGWFANSLGIGFEAQVTLESRGIRRLRGFSVYLWAVMKALGKLRCPAFRIRVDDRLVEGRRLLVCIGNGPRVGGGFALNPDARNDDGALDVCVVGEMGRLGALRRLPLALKGGHRGRPWVEMARATEIRVASEEGFPFHADGEVKDTHRKELTVRVVAGALRVIAPPGIWGSK